MTQRPLSRTQRRMEKKQAITLLFLVLAVSLVSFSLGVMVGRGGAEKEIVVAEPQPNSSAPLSLSHQQPPALHDLTPSNRPVDKTASVAAGEAPTDVTPVEKFTFYDTLPRGDQPLGSGINLPPATEVAVKAKPEKQQPVPQLEKLPVSGPQTLKPSTPAVTTGGRYVVQIASFKASAAAEKLRQRLAKKGYSLFVEPADLGNKGTWHRVFAGPYADRAAADQVAGQLKLREKTSPLVRKR